MRKSAALSLLVSLAWVPAVGCQTVTTTDTTRDVDIVFQSYTTDETCDVKYYVDGDLNDTVELHLDPANGPTKAIWTFSGGSGGSDYYTSAWVIFTDAALKDCLDDSDDIPKNNGGFRIMPGGTTKTVTPDTCVKGTYHYEIRAQKKGAGHCGADPKVKIQD